MFSKKFVPFMTRNLKELFRDPITMFFSMILPVAVLLMFTILGNSIPGSPENFSAKLMTPGIIVFGFAFIIMFQAMNIAEDKNNAFLSRVLSSPLKTGDFILGYSLAMIPLAIAQTILLFAVGLIMGMPFSWGLLVAIVIAIPQALVCIYLGIFAGSVMKKNQVMILANILVQAAGFLGGVYFDLSILSDGFQTFCYALPFANAVDMIRAACSNNFAEIFPHLWIVLGYMVVFFVLACFGFKKTSKN